MKHLLKVAAVVPALAVFAGSAPAAQIVFTETFDNTVNQTLVSTLDGWGYAMSSGNSSTTNTGQRQVGRMADAVGIGGTQGFVYNVLGGGSGGPQARGTVVWYEGGLEDSSEPLSLPQADVEKLEVYIGHANTTSTTRFLIRIDGEGWFVTTQSWTMSQGIAGGDFETQAELVSWDFSIDGSAWSALAYDGLIDNASSGFAILDSDPAGLPTQTLPSGDITAVGVYHWNSTNWESTRFDNFTVVAIPEPASLGLLALGSLVAVSRRRL